MVNVGKENRGLKRGLTSLISFVSMRIGSFSERTSTGREVGEEANGLSVRIGMVLVYRITISVWYGITAAVLLRGKWQICKSIQ